VGENTPLEENTPFHTDINDDTRGVNDKNAS
jgi:hypothetical protein